MIDYLLTFPTEQDAIKFFDGFNNQKSVPYFNNIVAKENGIYYWDMSRVTPNVQIITQQATYQLDANNNILLDKNGNATQLQPKITLPGFYMYITMDQLYDVLTPYIFRKAWRGVESIKSKGFDIDPGYMYAVTKAS